MKKTSIILKTQLRECLNKRATYDYNLLVFVKTYKLCL